MQPPQPSPDDTGPIVSVRAIKPIGGGLFAVAIRTRTGKLHTMVIPASLATVAYVAISAEVVAALAELDRL